MTTYIVFALIWTAYMGFETYVFSRPQSRPHFVGFLVTYALLAPLSFVLSASAGVLRDRLTTAYEAAIAQKQEFQNTDRKKLIG